ncbi:MAG: nitroreductase family protein [Erysipelotrichaceae bacterium]
MNETMEGLFARKSVRVFTPQLIDQTTKNLILDAAIQAPTAGNLHLYTILDITDPNLKARLAETCDHQPFIATAPMVLIFCADAQRLFDGFSRLKDVEVRRPGPGDLLLALSDALIAAQNAVVAAHSLGIGSCYIGDIIENCEEHRRLLNLPDYVVPIGMLVFGYPVPQQLSRKKPTRYRRENMVRENTYHAYSDEELRSMFKTQTKDAGLPEVDFDTVLKSIYTRKFTSDFALEMDRSASAWISPFLKK